MRRLTVTEAGRVLEAELVDAQMSLLADVFRRAGAGAEESWRTIMTLLRESPPASDGDGPHTQ